MSDVRSSDTVSDTGLRETKVVVAIPFRDRGIDPLRELNLSAVLDWWSHSPWGGGHLSDGRSGDEQFNRSAAYNRAISARPTAEVFIFTEADMLLPYEQVARAVDMAASAPGLVLPFTEYHYLSPEDSEAVRSGYQAGRCIPQKVMKNGSSIGAVNVVSRETLELVGGYTEKTEGNWYDDDIMRHAFEVCAGDTRWVDGPAYHLYHLPGWKGDHLTDEDRAATERNKQLWSQVRSVNDPDQIRTLLHG